jgi:hypothetical protein
MIVIILSKWRMANTSCHCDRTVLFWGEQQVVCGTEISGTIIRILGSGVSEKHVELPRNTPSHLAPFPLSHSRKLGTDFKHRRVSMASARGPLRTIGSLFLWNWADGR